MGSRADCGAGYAAWMNGVNKRNHCTVDRCLEKILTENAKLDPEIALAQAVNAKNSFSMYGGYSSYMLVFGKNPNLGCNALTDRLPALEVRGTSACVADHITAIQEGRKAFAEAVCDEKVKRAL